MAARGAGAAAGAAGGVRMVEETFEPGMTVSTP